MPRRSPPTPLRLHNGPLPSRGRPKHTLPSLPRPAFHAPVAAAAHTTGSGPVPRMRMANGELPALVIPDGALPPSSAAGSGIVMMVSLAHEGAWSGPSSPTSAGSSASAGAGAVKRSREFVRGPWDHSGGIHVPFDVGAVLPPPMPAAINGGVRVGEGAEGGRKWVV